MSDNSFDARDQLTVDDIDYEIYRLDRINGSERLPYSLKVMLENLLRNEDGRLVTAEQIAALAAWDPTAQHGVEIGYTPARVLMQDFTGVPCVVDLVGMRDAMAALGGDPQDINPLIPGELVIDHSVIADRFGVPDAFRFNADLEFVEGANPVPREVTVTVERDGRTQQFTATVRIDTPAEDSYYQHGGILQFVLRQLLDNDKTITAA